MAVVADVFEVVLIDADGSVIGSTTLQDGNIEFAVQETDVRSGRGNVLRGVLHSDRDIKINLTDLAFRYDWIAKQLGQDIVTGAGVAYAMPKWYEAIDNAGSVEITLDETPSDSDSVAIYGADGAAITTFTVSGSVVTLTSGVNAGDKVEVRTYTYATDASTESIEIDNSVFPAGVKAVLETVEIDESTETVTHKLQWQFDNALPSGNFTINTTSSKDAQAQAFNLRVVKPSTSNVVGKSLRIPV